MVVGRFKADIELMGWVELSCEKLGSTGVNQAHTAQDESGRLRSGDVIPMQRDNSQNSSRTHQNGNFSTAKVKCFLKGECRK